ncbi:hypothetical protein [Laspinema olomoucense]|nr:hypothetical protein [Laspinema sp. D3c]MCT7994618.1 hypothetical protein [Laspinema sp. D3c]
MKQPYLSSRGHIPQNQRSGVHTPDLLLDSPIPGDITVHLSTSTLKN